ncbi:Scube1 [Symbiodinium microadriaticum]|nr:Scube1 [Symbiodinium microadriaticum]
MSSCRIRDELDWDLRSFMSGLFPDTGLGTGASRDMAEAGTWLEDFENTSASVDLQRVLTQRNLNLLRERMIRAHGARCETLAVHTPKEMFKVTANESQVLGTGLSEKCSLQNTLPSKEQQAVKKAFEEAFVRTPDAVSQFAEGSGEGLTSEAFIEAVPKPLLGGAAAREAARKAAYEKGLEKVEPTAVRADLRTEPDIIAFLKALAQLHEATQKAGDVEMEAARSRQPATANGKLPCARAIPEVDGSGMFGMPRFAGPSQQHTWRWTVGAAALALARFAPCHASLLTVVSGPCETYNLVKHDSGPIDYGYGYGYAYGYGGYGGNSSYGTYGYGYGPGSYGSYTYGYSGDASAECGGGLCCVWRSTRDLSPSTYGENEECIISVASDNSKFIKMMDFEADVGDVLIVNGVNYSGYDGPSGVIPTGDIVWSTDGVAGPHMRAFAFCLDGQAAPVPEANSTFAWKVLSGRCTVDADGCIMSPNFPDNYDRHGCTISVDGNNSKYLSVSKFVTEDGYDYLEINGRVYSGTYTSADLLDPPQGLIKWSPDTWTDEVGWRLCLTDEVSNQTTWRSQNFPDQQARAFASAVWDAEKQLLLVYGGIDPSVKLASVVVAHAVPIQQPDILVKYDWKANLWTPLECRGCQARRDHTAVWDPLSRVMLVFGGRGGAHWNQVEASLRNELFIYDSETDTLTDPNPVQPDGLARRLHTAVWDTQTRTMLVFGGEVAGTPTDTRVASNHLLKYDIQFNSWTNMTQGGAAPAARYRHVAVLASPDRSMIIFGGTANNENDLWRYVVQAEKWEELLPPSPMNPFPTSYQGAGGEGAGYRAVWDRADGTMLLAPEMWQYDYQANTFKLDADGLGVMKVRRARHVAAWIPDEREVLMFSGEALDYEELVIRDILTYTQRSQACQPGSCECLRGFQISNASESCEPCRPGRYKDSVGSAPCVACPAGSTNFGLANVECIPCQAGFTDAENASGCEPVLAQIMSFWVCPRRKSCTTESLPGLSKYGQHYKLRLTSTTCNDTLNGGSVSGVANEGMSGYGEDDGNRFQWGERPADFDPSPSFYNVCLCASMYCGATWSYPIHVGQLLVAGPLESQAMEVVTCVLGRDCLGLQLLGHVLAMSDLVVVQQSECASSSSLNGEYVQYATLTRSEILDVDNQTYRLTVDFRFIQFPVELADYYLCWCAATFEGACQDPQEWVQAGRMRLEGPFEPQQVQCVVGQECHFPIIQGQDIRAGDRLMVLEACGAGDPLPGFPGDGILETLGTEEGSLAGQWFNFIADELVEVRGRPGIYRLCFCRPVPVPEVDSCTVAAHFTQGIGFMVLAGPLEKVTTCPLGSDCTVNLLGSNLAIGDQVLVVAGSCGVGPASPESIATLGFPSWTSVVSVTKNGAQFQAALGVTPWDGTPGTYSLCWCAASADCSSPEAFVLAGQLQITCPPGRYTIGQSTGRRCRACTRGYHCAGGLVDVAVRLPCPVHHTTKSSGAVTKAACECASGYRRSDDLRQCVSCEVGFYKLDVGNADTCTPCPEGLTTYMQGSISNASCIERSQPVGDNVTMAPTEEGVSNESTVPAVVLSIELADFLGEVQDNESLSELQALLLDAISGTLGGGQEALSLEFLPIQRRLATGNTDNMRLAVTIKYRSMDEAKLTLQDLDVAAVADGIAESIEEHPIFSSMTPLLSAPVLSEATVRCSRYRSVPPGVPVVSSEDCQCSPGYGFDSAAGSCEACAEGEYKATVGDVLCTNCPQWMSTANAGATTKSSCQCQAGRYESEGSCLECPSNYFCPGGRAKLQCPSNSATITDNVGGSSITDCICMPGYSGGRAVDGPHCIACGRGFFKPNIGNEDCNQRCPANADSMPGAVNRSNCFCTAGSHALLAVNNGSEQLEVCASCTYRGLTCFGGFDSSGAHNQPVAEQGFFQTGQILAAKCEVNLVDGTSVCLGGNVCARGSSGFLCGECPASYARDTYPGACSECSFAASWMGFVVFTDIAQNVLVNFAVASLAAMAAVKDSRSLHTSMIRIGTQFMTACSVLEHFEIEQLQVFDWSVERKITECAQTGDPCDDLRSMNFPWPPEVTEWFRQVLSVLDVASRLSAVSFTLSCWAEHIWDSKQAKQLVPAIYFVLLPLLSILSTYLLCALVTYLLVPLLRKAGIEITEAAKKRKQRKAALEVLGDVLSPRLEDLNLTFKDLKDSAVLEDLALPDIYLGIDVPEDLLEGLRLGPAWVKKGLEGAKESPELLALATDVDLSACAENVTLLDLLSTDIDASSLCSFAAAPSKLDMSLMDLLVRRALAYSLIKEADLPQDDKALPPEKLALAVSSKFSCTAEMRMASASGDFGFVLADEAAQLRAEPAKIIPARTETGLATGEVDLDTLDFGLFTRWPGPLQLLHQSVPVIWVTLINMWPGFLSQYLQMIWCQPFQEEDGVVHRLLPYPDVECWSSNHMPLATIAIIGLGCWCVGMPMLLIRVIWNLTDRNSPENQRRFGYFINGFEPRYWWYDLVIRRLDIAAMMLVTYTSLTNDERAKLLSYPVISGAQMAYCSWIQPFQNSQAQILDFFEIGLAIFRFLLFSTVAVILILAPSREATWVLAGSLAMLFTLICLYMALHILAQFLRDTLHKLDEAEEDEKKMTSKSSRGGAMKFLTGLVARVKRFAVRTAAPLFQERADEHYWLEWCFHSSSITFESEVPMAKTEVSLLTKARRVLLRFGRFYQYRSTGKALDDFASLWLGILRQSVLPKDTMEVLCVLTSAHKSVPFKTPKSDVPWLWKSRMESLQAAGGEAKFRFTPDEMITAIQRLGSLRAVEAVELVHLATLQKSPVPEDELAGDIPAISNCAHLSDLTEDEHAIHI